MTALIVGLLIAGLLVLIFARRSFVIERSREMSVDPDQAWALVADFAKWPSWSPWLSHEPECKLEYSENTSAEGGWYSWDGEFIGAGRMSHIKIGEDSIEQKLEFIRPSFKPSRICWKLDRIGDGKCRLIWSMRGSMPLLLALLVLGRMRTQIGRDFELGLGSIERLVNPQADAPKLGYRHPVEIPELRFVGIQHRCATDQIGPWMEKCMPRLFNFLEQNGIESTKPPFAIYNKRHFGGKEFTFTCALYVTEADIEKIKDKVAGADMLIGHYEGGGKFLEVVLEGGYKHLMVAWLIAFDHLKMRRLKFDWRLSPFEIYENHPAKVENSNELRTRILIGTR